MKSRKKKKTELIISIIALVILITISVLFILNKPKSKELVEYAEKLLEIKINEYVESSSGKVETKKDKSEYVNIKYEVKNFMINKFKKELDGKMNYYALTSDVYLSKYQNEVKKYIGSMDVDSFYQLSKDDRDIMGILCEDNGSYFFIIVG